MDEFEFLLSQFEVPGPFDRIIKDHEFLVTDGKTGVLNDGIH
jgi:hypothetical protein